MLRNKKAISGVVVTVLLVLISIIAVGILWYALRGTITKGAEESEKASQCFYLNLAVDSASYSSGTLTVAVTRGAGEADLSGVKVLVDGSIKTTSPAETTYPQELGKQVYTVSGLTAKPSKVEVAGVLTGGKICPISASSEQITSS